MKTIKILLALIISAVFCNQTFAQADKAKIITGKKHVKVIQKEEKKKDPKFVATTTTNILTDAKVKESFKVFTKMGDGITEANNQLTAGITGMPAFTISGMAAPKSKVKVEVYYSGKKEVYKKVTKVAGFPVQTEKEESNINNKLLLSKEISIGNDGKWSGITVDPFQPKSGDVGTTISMGEINIHFKAFNGDKEVLVRSVKLMVNLSLTNITFF